MRKALDLRKKRKEKKRMRHTLREKMEKKCMEWNHYFFLRKGRERKGRGKKGVVDR